MRDYRNNVKTIRVDLSGQTQSFETDGSKDVLVCRSDARSGAVFLPSKARDLLKSLGIEHSAKIELRNTHRHWRAAMLLCELPAKPLTVIGNTEGHLYEEHEISCRSK